MKYIRGLPINDTPEIFGLHDNANITYALNETFQLLNNIVLLQPRSSSDGGLSREEVRESEFKLHFYFVTIVCRLLRILQRKF